MENILDIIQVVLLTAIAVAVATERLTEEVKAFYLKIKNFFAKKADAECTKTEKVVITQLIGIALCILAGSFGVKEVSPITGVNPIIQQVFIGLLASYGSNILHSILKLILAAKDAAEGLKHTT
jgi:hypothetical protein